MSLNLTRKKPPPPNFMGHYAGFVSRLTAFVIDILVVSITIGLILGVASIILSFFNIDITALASENTELSDFAQTVLLFLTGFGFTFTVSLIYTTFFWMAAGKTIGKAVMGLQVIGPKGSRVTFKRALIRYVGYWISAIPLFLGYYWVLVNDHRHAWHDVLAGTSVIYDHEAQYSEQLMGRLARIVPRMEMKAEKAPRSAPGLSAGLPGEAPEVVQEENKE